MSLAEWTPEATKDLDQIHSYIARKGQGPSVADENYLAIVEQCNNYARLMSGSSLLGTARPELGSGVRSFAYKRWIILFEKIPETILVLAVFDGRRQYETLFSRGNDPKG